MPLSGPLLEEHQIVKSPEKDLARSVLPLLSAQWTLDGDRLKRELLTA